MQSTNVRDRLQDQQAALLQSIIDSLGPEALSDPNFPDIVQRAVEQQMSAASAGATAPPSADGGLASLVGLGDDASKSLGDTLASPGVIDYDDTLTSDRVLSAADLYYLYMHERVGVFQTIWKLQELFQAGTLRISNGPGAFGLYRFDKRSALRYRLPDRLRAYKRVFGYTNVDPGPNARENPEFHGLFTHFIGETAKFWRDRRISDVIRERAMDPAFGSIAIVRRAGLDLRTNVKNSSYGFINVLRIETGQALDEAFQILNAEDVRAQFGAENAWDMIELVMWQYFHRSVPASTMNRMAVTGRQILQWLAQPYVLETERKAFEAQLYLIAEAAEEWISSDEGMRLSRPTPPPRNVYAGGPPPRGTRRQPVVARRGRRVPANVVP